MIAIRTNKRVVAAFDFDGTITRKDTFMDLLLFTFGARKLLSGLVRLSPVLVLYKAHLMSNNRAKEQVFARFFSGMHYDMFLGRCAKYAALRIDRITRREAMSTISWHQREGHELVVISASMGAWVEPWAKKRGFAAVIGTEPEIRKGILTGRFGTPNCYGKEKVRRFLDAYPNRDDYYLLVYGDSTGDHDLMNLADRSFFRSFP